MPSPDGRSWPVTPDGATDWEMVFENPETGVIPLIAHAHSPETLKQSTLVVIRKLFGRKRDESNIEKFAALLDKIVPDDAPAADIDAMRAGVAELLRRIKEERQRTAAEYRARKKAGEDGERRTAEEVKETADGSPALDAGEDGERSIAVAKGGPVRRTPVRKTPPAKSRAGLVIAAVLAALAAGMGIVLFPADSPEKEAQGKAAVQWVHDYIGTHLRMGSMKVVSVKMSEESVIELEIIVSDAHDVELVKTMSFMSRVSILGMVCPPPDSGVLDIIDQGWRLWVEVRSPDEKLTGGSCRY